MKTVLPDGTVEYRYKGHGVVRYKPDPNRRSYQRRKPSSPEGYLRFGGKWFPPLATLEDGQRTMPETRPDSEAYDHMPLPCKCEVCSRGPQAIGRWERKWRKDHGLRATPANQL